MKKLQQFYIISLESSRLKKSNYKIKNLSLEEARKNLELISVGDSQMLRTVRIVRGIVFSQDKLDKIWDKRAKIKHKKGSNKRVDEIALLSREIDEMLFVEDIVSVTFNHVAHYKRVSKDGFFINGNRYVRLFAGAGHLRRSTVLFVKSDIRNELIKTFENGFDSGIPINHGKYGAYLGLYSSSTLEVSTPRFVVVPDLEIKRMRLVDFVEDDNTTVTEKTMEITHNVFDGQGLISIDMAKQWSYELNLDYDAVSFIFRAPFTKGLLVSFPFHSFSTEFGYKTIVDIYGISHDIEDVDVILTESQFKLGKYYKSLEEFSNNCEKNNLSWGVTRVNPEFDKDSFWSSYQYIQVLDENVDIDALTQDTLDYLEDVSSLDGNKTLVYLMGENIKEKDMSFDKLDNPILKALSMNTDVIQDPYIEGKIIRSLNKKIREAYTGKLLLKGNYQFLIFDPYALAQHSIIRTISSQHLGILKEGYHYSQYWESEGVSTVVSGRSPLTWRSEMNVLSFMNSKDCNKWFGHLNSGIIFNIHGVDTMLFGDADGDGDAIFTTDSPEMISGAVKNGKPVTYNREPIKKEVLNYDGFLKTDSASFNSKIGLITNYSTTYYSMQSLFDKNSDEYKEILKRLIVCRAAQGQEIDKTKGAVSSKPPEWGKKINGNELHNSILTNKRPHWMAYLYPHKKKEWDEHFENYDYYCLALWNIGILDLIKKENLNQEQIIIKEKFIKYSPLLLGGAGVMDAVHKKMFDSIKEIKTNIKNRDFECSVYMSKKPHTSRDIKDKLLVLLKLYNKMKKDFYLNTAHEDISIILEHIKNKAYEISSDMVELTDCAVELFYGDKKSNYDFVWQMFSDGIIYNMKQKTNKFKLPIQSNRGDFIFANKEYIIEEFEII